MDSKEYGESKNYEERKERKKYKPMKIAWPMESKDYEERHAAYTCNTTWHKETQHTPAILHGIKKRGISLLYYMVWMQRAS